MYGTYTSPIYKISNDSLTDDYLVYVRTSIEVLGAGNEWDDQLASPKTWNQVNASTRTWLDIFTLTAAPNVNITLKYGNTSPPTNEAKKMELLSAVISNFKYLQVYIEITDPGDSINALVEEFDIVLRRPT